MRTTNYDPSRYAKVEGNELWKFNDSNIKSMTETGRCNSCSYFNFGKRKCTKKDADLTVTYTEDTPKGGFIHFIKPTSCSDFTPKGKKKETAAKTEEVTT